MYNLVRIPFSIPQAVLRLRRWVGVFISASLCALNAMTAETPVATQRWDKTVHDSAQTVWHLELIRHGMIKDQQSFQEWKETAGAYLSAHPENAFAPDVALAIALGTIKFGNNPELALDLFDRADQQWGDRNTLFSSFFWSINSPFRCDNVYERFIGGMVVPTKDGSVKAARPWGEGRALHPSEAEALRYFAHLTQYPDRVRDFTVNIRASLLLQQGKPLDAQKLLERHISANMDWLKAMDQADRLASVAEHGFLIRQVQREIRLCNWLLIRIYLSDGQQEKAMNVGRTLLQATSADGWYWSEHQQFADMIALTRKAADLEAANHYELALKGYIEYLQVAVVSQKRCGQRWEPLWAKRCQDTLETLKAGIRKMGGTGDFDCAKEIAKLKQRFDATKEQAAPTEGKTKIDEWKTLCMEIASGQQNEDGVYTVSKDRLAAVQKVIKQFMEETRQATSSQDKNKLQELLAQRRFLAISLAMLAAGEPDAPVRERMLNSMRQLIRVPPARAEITAEEQQQEKHAAKLIGELAQTKSDADPDFAAIAERLQELPPEGEVWLGRAAADPRMPLHARGEMLRSLRTPPSLEPLLTIISRERDADLLRAASKAIEKILVDCPLSDQGEIVFKPSKDQ